MDAVSGKPRSFGASVTKRPANAGRWLKKRRKRNNRYVPTQWHLDTTAEQVVVRTSFWTGAASIVDVFGVLNSCDRLDRGLRESFYETEMHLQVANCWLGRTVMEYEPKTAEEERSATTTPQLR